jgi:phage-related protein
VAVAAVVALVWAFWPEISSFFTRVAAWAVDAFGRMWAWIKTAFASAKTFLVGVFEFVVGLLSMLFAPQIATAKSFVGVLVGLFNSAVGVIQGAWGPVSDFFARMWGGIVTAATSFYGLLTQVWAPIGDFFSRLWGGIVDSFMGIVGPILDRAMKVIDAVRSVGRTALGTETPAAAPAAPPEIINPGTRAASEAAAAGAGASGTVDGTIVVKAEKGTSAQVKAQPRSAPIVLQPSGAFP